VLLAHGSSDARHAAQVRTLAADVSSILGEAVDAAFLSDARLPKGARVLPLFMGAGRHVVEDVPKLTAASRCVLLPPLGQHADGIADLVTERLACAGGRNNVIFILYHFTGFERLSAALNSKTDIFSRYALASLHCDPSLTSVLQLWRNEDVTDVTVQPMLLFDGKSMDRVRRITDAFDVTMGPVLSELEGFDALVADCFSYGITAVPTL